MDVSVATNKKISMRLLLSEGTIKAIFDHIRNLLTCSFLLVLGLFTHKKEELQSDSLNYAGILFIVIAASLIILNLIDGIRKLKKLEHHYLLISLLVVLYVVVSFRLVVIAIDFRSSLVN